MSTQSTASTEHSWVDKDLPRAGAASSPFDVRFGADTSVASRAAEFARLGDAENARSAGRMNAASIDPAEKQKLIDEHTELVTKKHCTNDFSKADERRLTYVGWQLDRIEDAKHGEALDAMISASKLYRQLQNTMQEFKDEFLTGRGKSSYGSNK